MAMDNAPEGLDEFLTSDDPQAAVAGQGWQQTGNALLASQPVQNVISGKGLQDYQDTLNAAISGDPAAQQAVADHAAGMATMGIAAPAQEASGLMVKARELFPEAKSFDELYKAADASLAPNHPVMRALQQVKNRPGDLKEVQGFAEGGLAVPEGLDEFLSAGNSPPTVDNSVPTPEGLDEFIAPEMQQAKYGTPIEQLKAAGEGFAQGVAGPLAPMAEKALGVNPDDIRAREEANPVTHYASEVAGLVAPAVASGGAGLFAKAAQFTQAGALEKIGAKLLPVAGETLASKMGTTAAKAAIDNMLIAGSDEASKMVLNDPHQSAQSAIANIGLAGLIGGGVGGLVGAAHPLLEGASGKTAKLLEDFKARINEHISNPDPVSAMTDELAQYHKGITDMADEVYGPKGIKAQDVAKSVPELNDQITGQAQKIYDDMQSSIAKMIKDPYSYPPRLTSKLQSDLEAYANKVSTDGATSADMFNAAQDLKQTLQGYSKYDKMVKPVDEGYDFVKLSKDLAYKVRNSLEDKEVWGKAAQRQADINAAFKDYLPALKDFEKKFTTEIGGERQIDPTKVNTYLNQVGKPNAEIKQQMLKNFLDASEKYKKVIADSHANLSLEPPTITDSPLNVTMSSLGTKTLGSKLADAFIQKGLTDAGGKGLGGVTGAMLGHMVGHGALGAIIGERALGPFFSSVLPSIAKAVVGKEASATGFRGAVDFTAAAVKNEELLNKATKNLFKTASYTASAVNKESQVIPESFMPSEKDRMKLDKALKSIQSDPQTFMNSNNPLNHYMPDHAQAMDQSVGRVVSYLNSIRAGVDKKAPLDSAPVVNAFQKAEYQNALNIAQQPMIVLDKIKRGTVTIHDLSSLNAMYPDLYNRMKQKVTDEIVNKVDKKAVIPYTTRIGLSMFLGQTLDSTLSPGAIQAMQGINMVKSAAAAQQEGQAPQSKGVKSSPALQKMAGLYQTPGQARLQHKNQE